MLLVWLIAVSLLSSFQCRANEEAEAAIATLVVEPASISVARFDRNTVAKATVIARTNRTADFPVNLKPSFTASPGLDIRLGNRAPGEGDLVWPVDIFVSGDAPNDSTIDFRLVYPNATAAKAPFLWRARLALKVAPDHDASPIDDANVSIKTDNLDPNISDGAPATAHLLVTNKSSYPFAVGVPKFDKPDFMHVEFVATSVSVAPHEKLSIPLTISVEKKAKPEIGDWLIRASVPLSRGEAGQRTGIAVAEQKVRVGVPGVPDVLKALDLPSLLLIPGALVLATWSILLGAGETPMPQWLVWKSSSFWVVSITISIIIFTMADAAMHTDFFVAYNIGDVAKLWIGSIFGGAATFVLYQTAKRWWNHYCEPLTSDKPIDIIRKLERSNLRFYLESYPRVAGHEQEVFKLDFGAPAGKVWVVPQILLRQAVKNQATDEYLKQVVHENDQPDRLSTLVASLKLGLRRKWISLDWQAGEISGPQAVEMDQLKNGGGRNSPIQFS